MAIPVFTVDDLKDVRRLDGNVQFIDNPDFPVFFFIGGGSSRFFFINLGKFINFETALISKLAIEVVSSEEFIPPSTFRQVVKIYVDKDTTQLIVQYDDVPV